MPPLGWRLSQEAAQLRGTPFERGNTFRIKDHGRKTMLDDHNADHSAELFAFLQSFQLHAFSESR